MPRFIIERNFAKELALSDDGKLQIKQMMFAYKFMK